MVQVLIDSGASIRLRDNKNRTALHYAVIAPSIKPLKLVLALIQSQDIPQHDMINMRDFEGATPLHMAAERAASEAITLLLQAGADRMPWA